MRVKKFIHLKWIIIGTLFLCFFVGNGIMARTVSMAEVAYTAETSSEKEEFMQRYSDAVELAEMFRTDESFVHSFTFSAEEEKELKTLLKETVYSNNNISDTISRIFYIRKYVGERLTLDAGLTSPPASTHDVLCKTADISTVGSTCIAQVVRDLCLLDEIPCFRLCSDGKLGKDSEMVMVYAEGCWWFFNPSTDAIVNENIYGGLVKVEDAYSAYSDKFAPSMIVFDYDYDCESDTSLWGVPNGVRFGTRIVKNIIHYSVYYDKEDKRIKMYYTSPDDVNMHVYGSNRSTDAEGNAPSGFAEYARIQNGGEDVGTYIEVRKGYLQYGVALHGRITVDGVEYNFNEKGNMGSLPWYQQEEKRAWEGEERENWGKRLTYQKEQARKIAEALCEDPDYFFDMYYTEEELSYLNGVLKTILGDGTELSEKEKAIKILQYLKKNITYQTGFTSYDCYETLQRGVGQCTEFSTCFRDLCILSGIDCFCIAGSNDSSHMYYAGGDGSDHAWNLAKLDGIWYFVEPQETQLYYDFDEFNKYFPFYICNGYTSAEGVIAISKEGFEFQLVWGCGVAEKEILCYQFEDDGKLAIYAMTNQGVHANYDGSHDTEGMNYSTDENGKLKENYGFVTWEETERTEDGKAVHTMQGYLRQGFLCQGPTVINGQHYEFETKKHSGGKMFVSAGREIGVKQYYHIYSTDIKFDDVTYTGKEVCPKPIIKHGDTYLVEGKDYEIVSYMKNIDVTPSYSSGATCTIKGKGDYYDEVTRYFKILTRDISDMEVTMEWSERTWSQEMDAANRSFGQPYVSIDVPISEYTVSYSKFDGVGTGEIVIKGRYNCTGTIKKTCELKPLEMKEGEFEVVLPSDSYQYTGQEQKPDVQVKWLKGDGTLYRYLGKAEYDVTYENNIQIGKAKVLIDGCGKFRGRLMAEFSIGNESGGMVSPNTSSSPNIKPTAGAQTTNKPDSSVKPTTPTNKPDSSAKPTTPTNKPTSTVKPTAPTKKPNQVKVKKPGKPAIKSIKNKKGKKVVVTLKKKVSGATGYQLAYAAKSTMKGKKIKSFKGTVVTVKGLKKKKTYYFCVRAYTKKSGKTVYGNWGKKKKIKIKK